ncbi:MAG: hypothetical protein KAS66_00115 [Candidatus Omnitrophica bacterium]|nr:hypothetical protein [Candidatus Omnitrophota bacterium]
MAKTTNIDQVIRDVKNTARTIRKAEVFALNRAGRDTHPEAKRQLRFSFMVKAGQVNKAKRPPKRATTTRERYLLVYQARRINVKDYGLRQTKKGITWSVKRGKRIELLHGFKVGHNSPSPAVKIDKFGMVRTGRFKSARFSGFQGSARRRNLLNPSKRARMSRKGKREVIKSITGPSVPQLLSSRGIDVRLQQFFLLKYRAVLDRKLRLTLRSKR